jgi:alkylation response protein AidB-like acyl-CoA dehydrogenase
MVNLFSANILGKLGHGSEIAMNILQMSRIQTGVLASTMMKQMINYATEYCNDPERSGMQLK